MPVNWAPVGERLAKMQVAEQAAFDTRLGQRISRGRQEEDLKQELLKTQALQGVEEALRASGQTPEVARLGALTAQGGFGSDLSGLGQYILRNQEQGFRQSAVDAAVAAGDVGAGNPYLVGVATGPVKTTDITAGQAFNPYGRPDQPIAITDVGRAAISADNARAEQARAGATENMAQAAAAGKPKAGGGKAEKYTAPSQANVQANFNNSDGSFNAKAFQIFQQWRARNPSLTNGDEALTTFVGGRGRNVDPQPELDVDIPQRGTVADFNAVPDEDVIVVTDATGPRGVPMSQIGQATRPAAPEPLPAAARAKLKQGTVTRFGNGQEWTLTPEGEPTRIK